MEMIQYKRMLAYMRACVGDFSHAEDHVRRVVCAAMEILATEPTADRETLLCACILHDIGRPEQMQNPERHHAEVGAQKAYEYLKQNGQSEEFAKRVSDIISAHSSVLLAGERGIEAQILFEADKLDMIGAIGVCRTVAYGVEEKESIYDEADQKGDSAQIGGTILREMENDLRFAENAFQTRRGKELAQKKIEQSKAFIRSMKEEILLDGEWPI